MKWLVVFLHLLSLAPYAFAFQRHWAVSSVRVLPPRSSDKRLSPLPPTKFGCCMPIRTTKLLAENGDNDFSFEVTPLLIFGGIPVLSLGLVLLLQFKLIGALVIAKRLYVYALAAMVVVTASLRAAEDAPGLGTRLIDLTREILPNYQQLIDQEDDRDDQRFQEMVVLDEVDDSAQAVGLPLLVVSSLVASLFFVLLRQTDFSSSSASTSIPFLETVQSLLPALATLSNAAVVSLFARAELKRLPIDSEAIATAAALVLSTLAFLGPSSLVWPIQNILCVCLAIAVARAIQLPRLAPILLALTGLVLYDVASVGIQLVNLGSATIASQGGETVTQSAPSAASSAMGAVAISKTSGATWQPGLFTVRLRGIVTDLLGLGDSVFPSLLSSFCLRFDRQESTNFFAASLLGFATGCFVCEFVPGISGSGLPALLFIVPSMLMLVGVAAVTQGSLSTFWAFDASLDEENIS